MGLKSVSDIKDWLHNHWLSLRANFLYRVLGWEFGKDTEKLIKDSSIEVNHDFCHMTWEEYTKLYKVDGFGWGNYHPMDLHQWYDPAGCGLNEKIGAYFTVTNNTKVVTEYGAKEGTTDPLKNMPPKLIPYGIGTANSYESWGHGLYEWNMRLPKGAGLWPAAWVSSSNSWPPEVDIFEGYSKANGDYGKHVNSNYHLGSESKNHYQLGSFRHGRIFDHSQHTKFHMHWTKDFIKIYYNGFLVRVLTNKKHLKWYEGKKMKMIMGTGLGGMKFAINTPLDKMNQKPCSVLSFRIYKTS